MRYEFEHEIEVPFDEKKFILPDDRIALFKNLLDNYKVFLPGLRQLYAYLNFNPDQPIDYLVIFEAIDKNTGERIILWDAPYLYSNRTVPAYRYVVANNLYRQFFQFISEAIPRMPHSRWREFIPSNLCNLSFDSKDPLYWKSPDNAETLVKAMIGISMEYTPKPGAPGVRIRFHKKDLVRINSNENNSSNSSMNGITG